MGNWIFTFGSNILDSAFLRNLRNPRNPNIPDLPDDILKLIARDAPVEFSWVCKKLNQYWKSNVDVFDDSSDDHKYLENIRYLRIISWNYWKKYDFAKIAKNLRVLLINVPSTIFHSNFDIVDAFDCSEIKFCFYASTWSGTYEMHTMDKKFPEYHRVRGRKYQKIWMHIETFNDDIDFWTIRAIYRRI